MTPINATVYTRPHCMRCKATIKSLTNMGAVVSVRQLDNHPNKIEENAPPRMARTPTRRNHPQRPTHRHMGRHEPNPPRRNPRTHQGTTMTEARNRVGRQLTPLEQEIIHYAETTMTGAGLDPNTNPETFKDLIILFAGILGDNQ